MAPTGSHPSPRPGASRRWQLRPRRWTRPRPPGTAPTRPPRERRSDRWPPGGVQSHGSRSVQRPTLRLSGHHDPKQSSPGEWGGWMMPGVGSLWSLSWTRNLTLEGGDICSSRSPLRRDGSFRTPLLWGSVRTHVLYGALGSRPPNPCGTESIMNPILPFPIGSFWSDPSSSIYLS